MVGRRFLLLSCLLLALTSGCESGPTVDARTPEEVATAYLDALKASDWGTVYALASATDRAARDSVAFVEAQPSGNSAMEAKARAVIAYEQTGAEVGDSTATVAFDYTAPDTDAMTADLMGAFLGRAMAGEEPDEAEIADAVNRAEMPTRTTRKTVDLVRDPDGWRVVRHWDYAKKVTLADVTIETREGVPDWGIAPSASVTGTLTNTGDRDVRLVKVRLVLLNEAGAAFDETVEQAFYSMGDEPPVRPGYVKEWTAYLDESVAARVDSVRVEVADVELAE